MYMVQQELNKENIAQQMARALPEEQLVKIKNNPAIKWEEAGKEFYLNGTFYDVVNTKKINGETWYYCINDKMESQLYKNYTASLKSSNETLPASNQGKQEAGYLGVEVNKLKTGILIVNTAMVSVATSFVGVIAFMGLIVPHVLRLLIGSDNRKLIPASILMGALLLTLADMGARLLLAPSEMPIGIITSIVGAPLYIFLLKKYQFNQNDL